MPVRARRKKDDAVAEASRSRTDVLLVSMPFGMLHSPSLALGILQARLEDAGIMTQCRHFTVDYAARIGKVAYERIAGGFPSTTSLLGEWIFSHALNPRSAEEQAAYLQQVFDSPGGDTQEAGPSASRVLERELRLKMIEQILRLASEAGEFIEFAARDILAAKPRLVGLTSIFEQNLASIALARRLRALAPDLIILLGGANCEGEMGAELSRQFPFIDLVVSGEADLIVTPLVAGLLEGIAWPDNPALVGLVERSESAPRFIQARLVRDMSGQQRPDFKPYFSDLARYPALAKQLKVEIPMEASRGCWWGVKHHCTFCGLNGASMSFRSKSPANVLNDIRFYVGAYPDCDICFVDNIMDREYYRTLLPELARADSGTSFFFEIKSNVSKDEVRALRDAGVRHIQPGIESLSDPVLRLMRKGVSAIQNLQLLKWCMEFGVRVDWNVLWGFPGESPEDYEKMAELMPLLWHLEPPARGSRVRLDRHSPHFTAAEAFGFRHLRPFPSYFQVYAGLPRQAVTNLAFFFAAEHDLDRHVDTYTSTLQRQIDRWRSAHRESTLFYLKDESSFVVLDSRRGRSHAPGQTIRGLAAKILAECDKGRSQHMLERELPDYSPEEIARELTALCDLGLMWCDGKSYLSLPVCLTTYLESRPSERLLDGIETLLGTV
ncbi:RiPP maturation radical SAM protein 1 [Sphingomonas sp. ABOLE]|uniref:RiPP maturation radical SAM C-methyltransferase n=1 Tax=Sphingomonas sp. ABOLE TaxID=1985878 RepID=UPI000F7EEDD6|nr:RiPP maturation radical SAM C-methyltransferase [Sphingomonas sp. ABOLE]RSV39709.1 RiPP maturation radical SAM protein 1 [Sphingomonas sp. ABOLE]